MKSQWNLLAALCAAFGANLAADANQWGLGVLNLFAVVLNLSIYFAHVAKSAKPAFPDPWRCPVCTAWTYEPHPEHYV